MQTHSDLIIAVIAREESGGVVRLVRAIHESGCSIREARLVRFGDHLSMAVGLTGNWNAVAKLEDILARLDRENGFHVVASRLGLSATRTDIVPYLAEITGADRPGVIARMTRFFYDRGISLEDIHATTNPTPYSETKIASAHFTVGLPASLPLTTVRAEFLDLCDDLNVDGVLAPTR